MPTCRTACRVARASSRAKPARPIPGDLVPATVERIIDLLEPVPTRASCASAAQAEALRRHDSVSRDAATLSVYTDGSQLRGWIAGAAVLPALSRASSHRLRVSSVHRTRIAELYGLVLGLELATQTLGHCRRVALFTDLRHGPLETLDLREAPVHEAVKRIAGALAKLHAGGVETGVYWIPGHCGICGNEMAHATAQARLSEPLVDACSGQTEKGRRRSDKGEGVAW